MGFEPLIGNIRKNERKFIVIKPHLFREWLTNNFKFMEMYNVSQKYILHDNGVVKYRKYSQLTGDTIMCSKHIKTHEVNGRKQVEIVEISEKEYNTIQVKELKKTRTAYKSLTTNITLDIDSFYDSAIQLVELWSTDNTSLEIKLCDKALLEVTGNKYFSNEYIAFNQRNIITNKLQVIEGTDLIGKTTMVRDLVKQGFVCLDRDQDLFSDYVELGKLAEDIVDDILQAYKRTYNNNFYKYIDINVLYTDNPKLLQDRLNQRRKNGRVSEYDEQCVEYNELYKEIAYLLKTKIHNFKGICIQ